MKYCILMCSWVSENLDSLHAITVSAIFQHGINYVLQTSLQYPLEAWEANVGLVSIPKIDTTEEKGRVFKKTENLPAKSVPRCQFLVCLGVEKHVWKPKSRQEFP